MKHYRVLLCLLMIPVAIAFLGTGCESDSDDDDTSVAEGVSDEPGERLLWSETVTIAADDLHIAPTVRSPGVGKIVATMEWPEAAQLTAYFKKSGPANFGWVKGDSVLISTCEPMVQDEECTLYMYNGSLGTDLTVKFTIKYFPD